MTSDLSFRSASGTLTPLMRAAAIGHYELVRELLTDGEKVNELGPRDSTALMFAAGGGHMPIVRLLIENGADPFMCEAGGWTALDHALEDEDHGVIGYLADVMEQLRKTDPAVLIPPSRPVLSGVLGSP